MDKQELMDKLTEAGMSYDGHVTHGSLEAQMIVVEDAIAQALAEDRSELNRRSSGRL